VPEKSNTYGMRSGRQLTASNLTKSETISKPLDMNRNKRETLYFKPTNKIAEYQSHGEHSDARYTGIFGLAMSFIKAATYAGHADKMTEWRVIDFIQEIDGGYHDRQDAKRIPTAVQNAFNKAI